MSKLKCYLIFKNRLPGYYSYSHNCHIDKDRVVQRNLASHFTGIGRRNLMDGKVRSSWACSVLYHASSSVLAVDKYNDYHIQGQIIPSTSICTNKHLYAFTLLTPPLTLVKKLTLQS